MIACVAKIDGRKLDHKALEHIRILAVRRVVEDGEDPSEVMRSFGLCRTTIYPWLRKFNDEGWDALVEKIAQGPEPKLDEKQRQRVKRWILGKDPRQYGFEFGLWTRQIVQTLIQEKMGIELGLTAVGRLLASLEITPQKPLRRAYERDPQAVDLWMKETYPKLRKRAKRAGAMIFFLDEAGFQSDPPLGRTYGLKGTTPVVVTSGQRQSINVISAVNARGAFWAATYTGKLNAESFVAFLQNFMKGRPTKIFLVVDGHPAHKANRVKEYVQSLKGRLELYFLPPYAPDLNPDQFVWSHMKTNGVSKRPLKKNESLRERVEHDIANLHKNRELVRSFFCAESVAYAKD
ncbi:MAG: IS630 family transposase [Verrucomicrobiales bacterium]|nr:IS630 family transposase [Verrucomicrobiales bacterium]